MRCCIAADLAQQGSAARSRIAISPPRGPATSRAERERSGSPQPSGRRCPQSSRRSCSEIARFNVVAIRVEDESRIVVIAILAPETRTAIVFPAGLERRRVELPHRFLALAAHGYMDRLNLLPPHRNPEAGGSAFDESGGVRRIFRPEAVAKRLQRCDVERFRLPVITHRNGDVLNHVASQASSSVHAPPTRTVFQGGSCAPP